MEIAHLMYYYLKRYKVIMYYVSKAQLKQLQHMRLGKLKVKNIFLQYKIFISFTAILSIYQITLL